ncbi:helix-turn-helix domain-containing protein [Streptomyces sp. NPDC001219]
MATPWNAVLERRSEQGSRVGTETAEFARLLRRLKERSGRSYGALAGQVHLSVSTLHRYCNGDAVPTEFAPADRLARRCGAAPVPARGPGRPGRRRTGAAVVRLTWANSGAGERARGPGEVVGKFFNPPPIRGRCGSESRSTPRRGVAVEPGRRAVPPPPWRPPEKERS